MPTRARTRGQVASLIGDPRKVAKELASFRKSTKVLSSSHPRLIDRYPSQWVAVYDGKVSAHAKTLASLMVQVKSKKLPREHLIIRRIDRNPRTMIL